MAKKTETEGFRTVNETVVVTPPANLGPPRELDIIIPHYENKRADRARGEKRDCPYNTRSQLQAQILTPAGAESRVKSGEAVFCWNYCDRTDCPSYIMHRG